MSRDDSFDNGLRNRREVLGDAWVERSLARATTFTAEFQNLITRYAWDEIWSRPGLPRKTRRIMVLSVTMAMGRWEEFELHVRAGLTARDETGLTPDELKEVLFQNAIYAGVPTANTAFNLAQNILRDVAAEIGYVLEPASPANAVPPHEAEGRSK
jgi:4-carboxymuconolactone decarboxylase